MIIECTKCETVLDNDNEIEVCEDCGETFCCVCMSRENEGLCQDCAHWMEDVSSDL